MSVAVSSDKSSTPEETRAALDRIVAKEYGVSLSDVTVEFKRGALMAAHATHRMPVDQADAFIRAGLEKPSARKRSDDFRKGAEAERAANRRTSQNLPFSGIYSFMKQEVARADHPFLTRLGFWRLKGAGPFTAKNH